MKFTGKYDTIIESTITRFEQGGLLSGDIVRIRKDAMKNEKIKALTDQYKSMIEDAMNTDLNLRVCAIKSIRPTTTQNYSGGHFAGTRSPTDHYVDVVIEYAPGVWRDPITLPIEVLDVVDTQGNLAPVPDSVKRKSAIDMPKDVESPDADRRNPDVNTNQEIIGSVDDGRNQAPKPKEVKKSNQGKLTLEAVYDKMIGAAPGAPEGVNPGIGRFVGYTIRFGEPYGKNSEEIIKKIQTMPGLSNNMNAKFADDNTLTIKIDGDVDAKELENMISNVVSGTVEVSKDDEMTEFKPKGAVIAGKSPSISAA